MIFKRTIFLLVLLFFVHQLMAQTVSTIKASVNKNRILLGEPILLTVEIYSSAVSDKKIFVIDSITHFEFLEQPKSDSSITDNGITIKNIYTITSFDSGHWVIPSFNLTKGIKTDTIPIDVVFSDFDPEQEYHDIKDIIEVEVPKKKIAWWIYVVVLFVLILVIAILLRRKRPQGLVNIPKLSISPYDEAMKELEKLKNEKPLVKEYYSKLVNIFRVYIFKKKGMLSLQKTTDDLVVQLKSLNMNKEQFDKLSQSLRLSDFVKFAKYQSTYDDDDTSFEIIKNTIITLEQSE